VVSAPRGATTAGDVVSDRFEKRCAAADADALMRMMAHRGMLTEVYHRTLLDEIRYLRGESDPEEAKFLDTVARFMGEVEL
jgi:hypothetical protein